MAATLAALALGAVLVACGGGGGGGGSSSPGGGGAGGIPPTQTPVQTPTPVVYTGTLHDMGAQRYSGDGNAPGPAIAGATIVLGNALIIGATPPATLPSGDYAATSAPDGSFAVAMPAGANPQYVHVFPAANDQHISLHALAKPNGTTIRNLYLLVPSADEAATLIQINKDRAANGAPVAVIFDQIAMETGRAHTDFMAATGYFAHCIPAQNCYHPPNVPYPSPIPSHAPQYNSPDDLYNWLGGAIPMAPGVNDSENLTGNSANAPVSNLPIEQGFMSEKGNPGGEQGHYLTIVNPLQRWLGIANTQNGKWPLEFDCAGFNPCPYTAGYDVEEFYSPTGF